VITTDGSNNVINVTGSVGAYGDSQWGGSVSPGNIAGVIPGPVAQIGGGTNLSPIDNLFSSTDPSLDSLAFSFTNTTASLIGAGLWEISPGNFELFIGNWLSDRIGQLSVSEVTGGGSAEATTPLPGALWLFGSTLAGAASIGKWRRKRKANTAIAAA
jgi:hypothetical protein